jgi:uncharacterized membrane protein YbhN (UPF0104 family)
MITATIHLGASIVVPVAIAAGVVLLWYWRRLGAPSIAASRRWIRRASLAALLGVLPLLAAGLSFVDADRDGPTYVLVWAGALTLLAVVIALAVVDMMNTARLARRERHDLIVRQAIDFHAEPRRARPTAPAPAGERRR